jgi:hypothetical protein
VSVTAPFLAASSIPVDAEELTFGAMPYLWAVNLDSDQTVTSIATETKGGIHG